MITAITPAQRARYGEWVARYTALGLSCAPADRARAERGILAYYAAAKLPAPRRIAWVSSPLALALAGPTAAWFLARLRAGGAVARAVLHDAVTDAVYGAVHRAVGRAVHDAVYNAVDGAVNVAVYGAVHGAVGDAVYRAPHNAVDRAVLDATDIAVRDAVDSAVHGAVDSAVGGAVGGAVRGAVGDAVDVAVRDAVRSAVYNAVDAVGGAVRDAVHWVVSRTVDAEAYAAVGSAIRSQWGAYLGGAFWIGQVAWATFIRDVLGVADVPIGPAEDVATSCGWWWPHREFVVACDRPAALRRDAAGRLHSATGPAVAWRDGWAVYAWHGTRVPAAWIERPEAVDPALALTHPDVEERRCLAEILGWERVLARVPSRVVDADPDPQVGTLVECDLAGRRARFLRVRCGTGRAFALAVPPDAATARAANAWTYGLAPDELALETRT